MDPVRQLCVWLGVGTGHAALLLAFWGSGGLPVQEAGSSSMTVWLIAPVGDASPSVEAHRPSLPIVVSPLPTPVVQPVPRARATAASSLHQTAAVGESIEAVGLPPVFIERVEPLYPRGARLAGSQGVVRLGLEVSASGALRGVTVIESSGDASLDRAAVLAAQASSYGPARVSGRAVDAAVEATYRFELR